MPTKTVFSVCSALSLAAAMTLASLPAAAQNYGHQQGYNQQQGGDHRGDQGRGNDNRGGERRDNNGNVVAAGVLGMVLGAAIADSNGHRDYYRQHMNDDRYHARCQARYHSYDRDSGTYLGRDGRRHYCHM